MMMMMMMMMIIIIVIIVINNNNNNNNNFNERSLCFQLIETTCCLIGFPWQPQQHNDVPSGRHLGFSNFQFFFSNSNLNTENSEKTTFSD